MPGTPPLTTPDNLPRIGDADSPDIPRDMNALADATQVALAAVHTSDAAHDASIGNINTYLATLDLSGYRIEAGTYVAMSGPTGAVVVWFRERFFDMPLVVAIPGGQDSVNPAEKMYVEQDSANAENFKMFGFNTNANARVNYIAIGHPFTVGAREVEAPVGPLINVVATDETGGALGNLGPDGIPQGE